MEEHGSWLPSLNKIQAPRPKLLWHMTFVMPIMTEAIEAARNSLGLTPNLLFSPTSLLSRTGVRLQCSSAFKGGFRGRAANCAKSVFAVLLGGCAVILGAIRPALTQQGPTGASCIAYMNDKVVARYNCLAGTDHSGSVNFIQWEHGTASTGLGGWVQSGKSCFAASEEPRWKICRD